MIIEPDFPDHWKTQLLIQLTGDPAAPLMMIRIWAHCHTRKAWKFSDLSARALAAICRWSGEPAKLRAALLESGFLTEEPDGQITWLVAHDFDVVNATLVRNWVNGQKNAARHSPPPSHATPNGHPTHTQGGSDRMDRSDRRDGSEGLEGSDRDRTPLPPQGGKRKKSVAKAKLPSAFPETTHARMLAVNAIPAPHPRGPEVAWSPGDCAALQASGLLELAELDFIDQCAAVGGFYAANIPREMQSRFWKRTTLQKLLGEWGGELDKARAWSLAAGGGAAGPQLL